MICVVSETEREKTKTLRSGFGSVVGSEISREASEMMGLFYASAELSRRGWNVFLPVVGRVKQYDLVAEKEGRVVKVEVKGNRSEEVFWFSDAWYDKGSEVAAEFVIGVRAIDGSPVEFYVGLAREVVDALVRAPNSEWAPWRAKDRFLNRWDKLPG